MQYLSAMGYTNETGIDGYKPTNFSNSPQSLLVVTATLACKLEVLERIDNLLMNRVYRAGGVQASLSQFNIFAAELIVKTLVLRRTALDNTHSTPSSTCLRTCKQTCFSDSSSTTTRGDTAKVDLAGWMPISSPFKSD
jgi:hypothetical protein